MHHVPMSAHWLAEHNKTGTDMEDPAKNKKYFIESYLQFY